MRRAPKIHLSKSLRVATVLALLFGLLALVGPAAASHGGIGDLNANIVIETQAHPGPGDPGRCIAVAFVEFPEAIGGTDYETTVFDNLLNHEDQFFGPPFPDDDYTFFPFHSVVASGRHRWSLAAVSFPSGCGDAKAALEGRFTLPRAQVNGFYLCNGFAVTMIGTSGNDTLVGTKWADTILGLDGDDTLLGKGGKDVLCGNAGNDKLDGGRGNDILEGGFGADLMIGRRGNDQFNGGPGSDTVDYKDAPSAIAANLSKGRARGEGADRFFLTENLKGSAFGDTLTGNGGKNMLSGRAGDDVLTGKRGADILLGMQGDDDLRGGAGSDMGDGGRGNDVCSQLESQLNCEG